MPGVLVNAPTLPEAEAMAFLAAIEARDITLTTDEVMYAGDVTYQASNGWTLVVFNDCASFDYVDRIDTNDGRSLDTWDDDGLCDDDGRYGPLRAYRGPADAAECWRLYGIHEGYPEPDWSATLPSDAAAPPRAPSLGGLKSRSGRPS